MLFTTSVVTEIAEGFYAAIARALIVVLTRIPGVGDWWETSEWKQIAVFGLCILSALSVWAIECPLGWADIPAYDPRCDMEGVILDVLYPAFLAWLFNWAGEEVARWVRRKFCGKVFVRWLSNPLFYLFLLTVAIEFILFLTPLPWQIDLFISVTAAILAAIFGLLLPRVRAHIHPLTRAILWWVLLVVKMVVHLLPIPFYLKPIINVTLTVALFILVNFIL